MARFSLTLLIVAAIMCAGVYADNPDVDAQNWRPVRGHCNEGRGRIRLRRDYITPKLTRPEESIVELNQCLHLLKKFTLLLIHLNGVFNRQNPLWLPYNKAPYISVPSSPRRVATPTIL
jgi:hypothetical protein